MTGKASILWLAAVLEVAVSMAQQHWKDVDSLYQPLPSGVHIHRWADSLNGRPFIGYYVSAPLKDKRLIFSDQVTTDKRFTPSQFYQLEQFPLLVVNCTYFSFETNQNISMVMKDGALVAYNVTALRGRGEDSMLYYYPTRGAIGIDRKRRADVAWTFTDTTHRWPYAFEEMPVVAKGEESNPSIYELKDIEWKWWKMRTAVGGGPVLIHDGRIWITYKEEQLFSGGDMDRHPRTAMGYTKDGHLIILAIQGRSPGVAEGATLEEVAKMLLDLKCYEAVNLDGGGSSCMLVNGKETIKPSDKEGERPVPAVFLIREKAKNK
ncbi:MAG TPA: phosphodiester glycosidase family protein [Puia sp.]|nr:phosphodiester glycosidase family protein [Puia sp.]